jgi:hypothetical protein
MLRRLWKVAEDFGRVHLVVLEPTVVFNFLLLFLPSYLRDQLGEEIIAHPVGSRNDPPSITPLT